MQKERGSSRSLSLHEEIEREAREIEKEMKRHPELDDIQVTEEMDAALLKKIQAYEEELEEEREAVKKVEENLRRNHYISGRDADAGSRADIGDAAGNIGKTAASGRTVRHFRVPGDSVEFSAELMPEIPGGFGLGGRDAGKARNSAGNGDVVSGYVGHAREVRTGYAVRMEEGVSEYAGCMEETAGYSGHMEAVSAYGESEKEIAPGYGENTRAIAHGYVESTERTMHGYGKNTEKSVFGYDEGMEIAGAKNVSEDAGAGSGSDPACVGQETEEESGGEKVLYRKKRRYWWFSLAAVLVIVMGVGVTSVGSKSHWKVLLERITGGEPMNVVNTEDMDSHETEDVDELVAYQEIREKLNFKPVRIRYRPPQMILADYEIQEEILSAQLLYNYKDEIIRYYLYMNDVDSSLGRNEEDYKIDEYTITTNGVEIQAVEYEKSEGSMNRQEADFEYQGVHYHLKGVMEREEFENILKNLYFF